MFSDVSQSQVQHKEVIVGIVTDIDLLHHVSQKEARSESSSGAQTPNNELEDENWSVNAKLSYFFLDS